MSWLSGIDFLRAWGHLGRGKLNLSIVSFRLASRHVCVTFSTSQVNVGGPSPLWAGPSLAGGPGMDDKDG